MEPEDTKEVTELMKYVEVAQTQTIIQLKQTIRVSLFQFFFFQQKEFVYNTKKGSICTLIYPL